MASLAAAGVLGGGTHTAGTPPRLHRAQLIVRGAPYAYAVYVPSTYRSNAAAPLLVVIHGCATTADAQAQISDYTPLAERYGFLVLYPDVDGVDLAAGRCWQALFDPQAEGRGRGDAGAIAAMTHTVMRAWSIDPHRVYAIGISAGGFEASILGADYPDLYAAIGIHSGAAYMSASLGCALTTTASSAVTRTLAGAALRAMGPRARVMPVILFHGDADPRIPYGCGEQAFAQWLATDDAVLRRMHRPPLASSSTRITRGAVSHGRAYTVRSLATAAGCTLLQFWTIHGMGHYWSGGSKDPAWALYTDPRGPSAAAASWAFFSHLRLAYSLSGMCR